MAYLNNISDEERKAIRKKAQIARNAKNEANKLKVHKTLSAAVEAKCKECIYDPYSGCGTWRQQVEGCTSYGCPLHEWRPTSKVAAHES